MATDKIVTPVLKLAIPIMFIQVCQASLGLADTFVAGRYNVIDLAGIGLGSSLWTPVLTLITGVLYALVPKISASASTGRYTQMQQLFQHGKKITVILSTVGFILIQLLAFLCPLLIDDQQVATVTRQYLHYIAFGMPGLIYMVLNRFFCEGNSCLKPVFLTTVVLSGINLLLNYGLVNGWGILPRLGGAGCGLATAISVTTGAVMIHVLARRHIPFAFPVTPVTTNTHETKALFFEGLPVGISIVVEVLALTLLAFFASSMGTAVIAAHQIAINIALVVFMIPLALSSAATIRVAHFSGHQQQDNTAKTSSAVFFLTMAYGILMAVMINWFISPIVTGFSHDPEVQRLLKTLLGYIALFQFADAIMIVASGILRGMQEFIKPLIATFAAYWIFILPLSYVVGVQGWWWHAPGIQVIWSLLIAGLTGAAIILVVQVRQKLRDPRTSSPQSEELLKTE
ncbi:Multidrug resistance protein NorM [Vibrio aerogenes CECT 7868]|uniref:Multidrug resistance protein NorM n=1 Tax=Vibrio aerogenes CECT 7868 TaxID=1216006 RepID=A0A1M5VU92_9VIBR|nr:MATE family efflux transporter [Vibrio aerogenes]SHH78750.1 Multidrug resistance protein NorM [Vibrio aerogenes CECT 7868]